MDRGACVCVYMCVRVCVCTCSVDVWVFLSFTPQDGPLGMWIEASFTEEIFGFGRQMSLTNIKSEKDLHDSTAELADTPVWLYNLKNKKSPSGKERGHASALPSVSFGQTFLAHLSMPRA